MGYQLRVVGGSTKSRGTIEKLCGQARSLLAKGYTIILLDTMTPNSGLELSQRGDDIHAHHFGPTVGWWESNVHYLLHTNQQENTAHDSDHQDTDHPYYPSTPRAAP